RRVHVPAAAPPAHHGLLEAVGVALRDLDAPRCGDAVDRPRQHFDARTLRGHVDVADPGQALGQGVGPGVHQPGHALDGELLALGDHDVAVGVPVAAVE